MIEDLLEIAEHLARRDPNRPKQVSLRRAVSSSRYALFHALALLCADQLVGWRKPWSVFTPIYRSLDHRPAKKVLEKIRGNGAFGAEVVEIGKTFAALQEWRHTADYDPQPLGLGRTETLPLVEQARKAVQALNALPNDTRLLLAVHLIARSR